MMCLAGETSAEDPNLPKVLIRYGLTHGYVQPIGIHHGLHIQAVAKDSYAEKDGLKPHDVIVRVNGEGVRSLAHLELALENEENDEGEVALTLIREGSLSYHEMVAHLYGRPGAQSQRQGQRP
jgi:S1-C subfamily serine protease